MTAPVSADGPGLCVALAAALGVAVLDEPARAVHGGCIGDSYRLATATGPVFVKLASAVRRPMLEAEARGLAELAAVGALRVPAPRALGDTVDGCFLALEWLDFGAGSPAADARLGEGLAVLHRCAAPQFGFAADNFIGSSRQPNGWADDWVVFLRERRLGFQLELAARNGHGGRLQDRGQRLLAELDVFFATYRPTPALLHGDLWGGNWGTDTTGQPVIFDPAVYYGDREADIAMTRLFGGFGPGFYAAYVSAWPLDAAAGTRRELYNLYHVLNHLNLFGGGYRAQAEAMIDQLLAAIGH
jgi:protein-ribulosamine 3-kinase